MLYSEKQFARLVCVLGIVLAACVFVSLCVGRYSLNPHNVVKAIAARITGVSFNDAMERVVFYVRLPRIIASMLIGMAISVSGLVYQNVFRNPLVSPDLLGVSSGASLGAAAVITTSAPFFAAQIGAFAGGMTAVALTVGMTRMFKNRSNMMLVISGIIVSGFMTSMLGIVKFFAEDRTDLATIVFWQMGSLASINYWQIILALFPMAACLIMLNLIAWRLNILSLGEEEARTVGINVNVLRGLCIVSSSLLTASAVSVSGTIGWIGLVIPHLGRLLTGADNTKVIPVTMLLGAAFLLALDTLARAATSMEIPLSILTGIMGAPFYAWLLNKQRLNVS
jgi:iron complex transport system permease protein